MTLDQHSTGDQDRAVVDAQSFPDGITDAARFALGLRAEATAGAPPVALDGGGDQGKAAAAAQSSAGGGEFNWGLFPDVPEEQRALLEPHLKTTQGHVTKLEKQYAPYKGLIDAGLDADTVQGIVALNQSFDQDPTGTWVRMGQEMQQRGLLPGVLDMQAVADILAGKDAEEPAGQGGGEGDQEVPAYARELQERLDRRDQEDQQRTQKQQQQAQEQQLEKAVESITSQLKEAGLTDEAVAKINIVGPIIANKGDPDAALQEIIGFREEVLKGLTDKRTEPGDKGDGVTLTDKGPPTVPESGLRGRNSSKGFAKANASAKQFLDRQRAAG